MTGNTYTNFLGDDEFDFIDGTNEDFSDFFNATGKQLFIDDQVARGISDKDAKKAWRNASKGVKDFWRDKAKDDKQEGKDERKERVKELGLSWPAVQAKKVALAPSRGAFIALLMLNFRGFSARLNAFRGTPQEVEIEKQWLKLGGDYPDLLNAIDKGKNKKPLLCGAKCKAKLPANFSGFSNFASDADGFDLYNYPTGAEETAATAATAYPVLQSIGALLTALSAISGPAADVANDVRDAVEGDEAKEDEDMTPEEKEAAEKNFEQAGEEVEAAASAAEAGASGIAVDNKLLLFGLAAIVAVLLLKRK